MLCIRTRARVGVHINFVKKISHKYLHNKTNLSCMQGKWLACCARELKLSYISAAWEASALEGLVGIATRTHGHLVANLAGLAQRWIPILTHLIK
jgi:hypothetical protein